MTSITISEFRSNILAFVEKIQRGKKIALTSHGETVAEIGPSTPKPEDIQKRLEYLRKHSRVGDIMKPMGKQWEAQD